MKTLLTALICTLATAFAADTSAPTREQAMKTLEKAVRFFRSEVAVQGTYLWQYSDDLSKREGEGKATPTQGWVQPPGTPSVGLAFLNAWQATSNNYYLEAARETAHALARGQLLSGGWTYSIDFSDEGRRKLAYRDGGKRTARNYTTFDDDTTQCALRFLMRTDAALGFRDTKVRDTIDYALSSILKAQYPNGAWPQGYDQFPDPNKFPVQKASYPDGWPRVWPGASNYWLRYTLNDNALARTIETLFEADRIYGAPAAGDRFNKLGAQCRVGALMAGDFLLRAQMPEPQPAWAQQYDFGMHPSWARKFEPPSVTGGESQGVLRMLMMLYTETGDGKYLEPIPRALSYLRRSRLPNGQLARFYELRSNKPLYFTKTYELTYDDGDMPTHYAFKVRDDTDAIARGFQLVKSLPLSGLKKNPATSPRMTEALRKEVSGIIAAQDARGRWIEEGRLRHHGANDPTTRVIRSATFAENVETLSRFITATK